MTIQFEKQYRCVTRLTTFNDVKITSDMKAIYFYINGFAEQGLEAYPSYNTMSEELGIAFGTVRRAVAALEASGLLKSYIYSKPGRKHDTEKRYVVAITPAQIANMSEPTSEEQPATQPEAPQEPKIQETTTTTPEPVKAPQEAPKPSPVDAYDYESMFNTTKKFRAPAKRVSFEYEEEQVHGLF